MVRATLAGYLTPGVGSWMLGENVAFGIGSQGTAAGVVRQWMASPGHRAVVLDPSWREAGVGVAEGSPEGDSGATFTLDVGRTS